MKKFLIINKLSDVIIQNINESNSLQNFYNKKIEITPDFYNGFMESKEAILLKDDSNCGIIEFKKYFSKNKRFNKLPN